MKTIAAAALVTLVMGCSGTPVAPDLPDETQDSGTVSIQTSYRIPHAEQDRLSHAPAVVFTADGERMVATTSDGDVVIFEAASRQLLERMKNPNATTNHVAIDPAGRIAAWTLKTGGVAVVEIGTGKTTTLELKGVTGAIAISPDARTIAVASGFDIALHSLPGLTHLRSISGHQVEITNIAWSPDGKRLASTAADGRLLVHSAGDGSQIHALSETGALYAVAFHPTADRIAYGGHAKVVYEYSLDSETKRTLASGQPYYITCLGYSPDGGILAVGDESCDIWLFRLTDAKMLFHGKHHQECWLAGVSWARDNETFLFSCRPNGHAGTPTIVAANQAAEAARSEDVRRARARLDEAIERHLATVKDPETKKKVRDFQMALAVKPALEPAMANFPGIDINLAANSTIEDEKRTISAGEAVASEIAIKRAVLRKVAHLLELSYMAFDQKRYDRVIQLTDEVLLIDPYYSVAKELKEDAQKARHKEGYWGIIAKKVDAWKRLTDADDEAVIPWSQTFKFPAKEEWAVLASQLTEAVLQTEGGLSGSVNLSKGPALTVDVESLPEEIRDLAREHRKTYLKELKEMNKTYSVNQWRFKR